MVSGLNTVSSLKAVNMQYETPPLTVCFSGHRPQKLPWGDNEDDARCRATKLRLISCVFAAYERGYRRFISGMAEGVDVMAAEAVLKLRELYPDVQLECALPYPNAENGTGELRARRLGVIRRADSVSIASPEYNSYCMHKRNRYMVDSSTLLIAVYSGERGGTDKTIEYAKQRGLEIVLIDPCGQV